MPEYMSKTEYRTHKSNLTRAINSGDPREVLRRVERFVERANATVWPDDWHRWNIALQDAFIAWRRSEAYYDDADLGDAKVTRRFQAVMRSIEPDDFPDDSFREQLEALR